jgi:hypothetical protein
MCSRTGSFRLKVIRHIALNSGLSRQSSSTRGSTSAAAPAGAAPTLNAPTSDRATFPNHTGRPDARIEEDEAQDIALLRRLRSIVGQSNELLQATGASVDVYCPAPSPEMKALALRAPAITRAKPISKARPSPSAILHRPRRRQNSKPRRAARAPANMVDKPDFSDFQFGTWCPLWLATMPMARATPTFGRAPKARPIPTATQR